MRRRKMGRIVVTAFISLDGVLQAPAARISRTELELRVRPG
jgi:hypothetical protein